MNRDQKLNRAKRVRLAQEKHGSSAALGDINPTAEKLAKDKTTKAQRVGNYFIKIQQGIRGQHTNVVPESKLYKAKARPSLFAYYWNQLKLRLGV